MESIAKGLVLSDLHIFARRSQADVVQELLQATKHQDVIVLNGDIFDFRWSILPSMEETIAHSVALIRLLCTQNAGCHVYYLMGNHDDLEALGNALDGIECTNFSWHPT